MGCKHGIAVQSFLVFFLRLFIIVSACSYRAVLSVCLLALLTPIWRFIMAKGIKEVKKGDMVCRTRIGRSKVTVWDNPDEKGNHRLSVSYQKGIYNPTTKTWTNPQVIEFSGDAAMAVGAAMIKAGEYLNRHQQEIVGDESVPTINEALTAGASD